MAFVDEQLRIKKHLEGMGHQVLISDYAESFQGKPMEEIEKQSLLHKVYSDAMKGHYEKIKNSDAILVLNYDRKGIANYIGGNTFMEMGFAYYLGKKIYLLNPIPQIDYYQAEIEAMKPTILNGDFRQIP